MLQRAIHVVGARDWKRIASEFLRGARTHGQCYHRWRQTTSSKRPWTAEEDAVVRECMRTGTTRYRDIAMKLPGRIGKQVRERWVCQLQGGADQKRRWTAAEDDKLLRLHAQYGNKWVAIARELDGRSENTVKNRWHSAAIRKRRASGSGAVATAVAAPPPPAPRPAPASAPAPAP